MIDSCGRGPVQAMRAPPLSLYVHLPWCERKCPYCDFNSYQARGAIPEDDYVDALLRDLAAEAALADGRPLGSVFIGGGTPSLFSGGAIRRLLDGIRARAVLDAGAEITLEANPGSIEARRFAAFREAGVNRLSIGIQSFRDAQLEALGRVHDAREARRAVVTAKQAGFDNFNLDLMYGLPRDNAGGALSDLETALALGPGHVSWYQLAIEPNTNFHRHPPLLPEDDEVMEIERRGRALLESEGYLRYEISAFARAARHSKHNLNYWRFGDYLGIGAGAHGKVTLAWDAAIVRRAKRRSPLSYMLQAGAPAAASSERIESGPQLVLEFMMNALRLVDGIGVQEYRERTGQSAEAIERPLAEAVRRGWLVHHDERIQPTASGLQFLNDVLALFLRTGAGTTDRRRPSPAAQPTATP
jgi:putative oxygen-independent coproporphyrinogen III oxidase